ncbi:hypothetical protein IFM89_032027 [Coptis chinensis]|uniref:Uncharacterized protein n=1 Tax=Coptis chinensis TaxID=261450 RepID=A0A835GZE6_9MAGN|nr:hypothetical protein IFM89_032027 [Coptis chinensis]
MQEERRREHCEEKEDVTKKSDILDFYFNLSKNVAYGAKAAESSRRVEQDEIINTDASGKEVVPRANSPSNSAKFRHTVLFILVPINSGVKFDYLFILAVSADDLLEWKDFPKGLRVLLLDEDSVSAAEIKPKLEEMDCIA